MTRKAWTLATLALALTAPIAAPASAESVSDLPKTDTLTTDDGPLEVRAIGHATFVLEWQGKTIYVDPVGASERFAPSDPPDLILITDVHGDHLSADTVQAIATPETRIVAPPAVVDRFPATDRDRITPLANGASLHWGAVKIAAIPMYNTTPEWADRHVKGRGNGYVIELGGRRIYVSGDTEDIPEMRALEAIDLAFVCMNPPNTMDLEAAADAVLEFQPKVVYPYHYRSRQGFSDVGRFRELVSADPGIEVRLLAWY
jgi:L-ascorbate metabolism protein UlaG (beta-lactamase superfamily)